MTDYRYMVEQDIPALAELERKYFSIPWSEKSLRNELQNDDSVFIVAETDGVVAGYAGVYIMGFEAGITNVVVDEKFRKNGIGNGIVNRLIEECEKHGVSDITLEVRESNIPALELYKKNGFVSEGKRPGFYDKPKEDAVIMWKRQQK